MSDDKNVLERALSYVAGKGLAIPPEVMQEAETARIKAIQGEQDRVTAEEGRKSKLQRMVDAFISNYPTLQDSVVKIGNWIMALIKLFAVNGLASVIMFASLIAEVLRVIEGLAAIESRYTVAVLIAVVSVASIFFLEFARFYQEKEAQYTEPPKYKWSLRLFWQGLRYKLGLGGEQWQADQTTPAQTIILAQRLIVFAVVVTALYGSMSPTIAQHKGTWSESLVAIVKDSSLNEFASWIISLLITVSISVIARVTSHFVASRAKLLEDSTFAVGQNKIELIGLERAANVVMTYYEQSRRARSFASNLPTNQEFTTPVKSVNPRKVNTPSISKAEYVKAWFNADPERLNLTPREAAKLLSEEGFTVSHVTVNSVKSDLLNL